MVHKSVGNNKNRDNGTPRDAVQRASDTSRLAPAGMRVTKGLLVVAR